MIAGIFIRDYKNYSGTTFVPVAGKELERLAIFAGINGVGKSAILESLDCFFNQSNWNLRKGAKREDAMIAPIFVIPKHSDFPATQDVILCSKLWSSFPEDATSLARVPALKEVLELRKRINTDDNWFFSVAINPYKEHKNPFLQISTIWKLLEKALVPADDNEFKKNDDGEAIGLPWNNENVIKHLRNYYDYAYLPVELKAQEMTMLQAVELQRIMGKKTNDELYSILTAGHDNILDAINEKLDEFIKGLNGEVEKVNDQYKYKTKQGVSERLKAEDIISLIFGEYLEKRTLKKGTTEISELSSGEQRIALMDVLYAFLASPNASGRHVIIGIDEPEASMHTSICYEQFNRAFALSNTYGHQTLLTTHWYGFLPLSQSGLMHHLEDEGRGQSVKTLSLMDATRNKGQLPGDLELKSYFDLTSSILSFSRVNKVGWVFCEGADDAIYLREFLKIKLPDQKINVVSLGGAGNVIKLYKYLYLPITDKDEADGIKAKILFLYDTDRIRVPVESVDSEIRKCLYLRRLQMASGGDVSLIRATAPGGQYHQTETEDCLVASRYYMAVNAYLSKYHKTLNAEFNQYFELNEKAIYANVSNISSANSFIKLKDVRGQQLYETIYKVIMEDHIAKREISKIYCDGITAADVPDWVDQLVEIIKI